MLNPVDFTFAPARKRLLCVAVMLIAAAGMSACGNKEKKSGQALASVNGEEITILQLNEELQRAGVSAAQQEAASKQLLESLIDRQLLQNEAARDKTDRDPKVVQAIERAKALIVAQSYLQKRIGNIAKPTPAEIGEYFQQNPAFFTHRKVIDLKQIVMATKDADGPFKAALDGFKSLDEAAAWLEGQKVAFGKTQMSRSTADLPPEMSSKLLAMPKGQLFVIREGERTLLNVIAEVKEAPVTLEAASNQIGQFLYNKKTKEASDAELARLRAGAKIEYLGKAAEKAAASAPAAKPAAPAAVPAAKAAASAADSNERGVAGLK